MVITGKVTFFLPDLGGGGAERVFLTLAKEFSKNNIQTELVVCNAKGPYLDDLPQEVKLVELGYGFGKSSRIFMAMYSLFGLARYIKKYRPYCLVSTLTGANLVLLLLNKAGLSNTRIIIREANTLPNLRNPVYKLLVKWLYPTADLIVAVSGGVADDLRNELQIPATRIRIINNPVDIDEINKLAEKTVSHPWINNTSDVPVILGIGRLVPQKDFTSLIKAFAVVRRKVDCRLILLGDGKQRSALLQCAAELGISNDISLPGFSPRPFYFLKRASVFVLSSRWEGFPNVLLQALALGTPVIATDCHSGPREILQHGKYGALVPVGDYEAMSIAITGVINSPTPEKRILQESARQYDPGIIAALYIKALTDI